MQVIVSTFQDEGLGFLNPFIDPTATLKRGENYHIT